MVDEHAAWLHLKDVQAHCSPPPVPSSPLLIVSAQRPGPQLQVPVTHALESTGRNWGQESRNGGVEVQRELLSGNDWDARPATQSSGQSDRPGSSTQVRRCRCVAGLQETETVVGNALKDKAACLWPLCTPFASWGVGLSQSLAQEPLLLLRGLRSCWLSPTLRDHAIHIMPGGGTRPMLSQTGKAAPPLGPPRRSSQVSSSATHPHSAENTDPPALAPLLSYSASRLPW